MQKLIIAVFALLLLAACSKHYHPLMANKKAKLVSELINDNLECSSFKNRLASPSMDDDAIDEVYHEAMKAHCVHKDV